MTIASILFVLTLPLLLLALGLAVLLVKAFRGGDSRDSELLEAARSLERTLDGFEKRLLALEDIILASTSNFEQKSNASKSLDEGGSGNEKI